MSIASGRTTIPVCSRAKATAESSNAGDFSPNSRKVIIVLGLLHEVSKQLQATGVMGMLNTVVERAKTLMTVEQHTPVNPIATVQTKPTYELLQLQQQITVLTA